LNHDGAVFSLPYAAASGDGVLRAVKNDKKIPFHPKARRHQFTPIARITTFLNMPDSSSFGFHGTYRYARKSNASFGLMVSFRASHPMQLYLL
jgi:hypothetical protein